MKNLADLTNADKDKLITDLYALVAELRLTISPFKVFFTHCQKAVLE
jgi:hypothetical protein